jgi:cell division protein FtsB
MKKTDYTWYWLALALVCALALAYIDRHDLKGRYEDYRETMRLVSEQEAQVEALKAQLEEARHRLNDMDSDPVEQEATIRRVRRLVREGEIVYRVEALK